MTKKLTIGAAVMALPALVLTTGPAGAQPAPDDDGITQAGNVVLEIGVDLNSTIAGSFIELHNTTEDAVSVVGWQLSGCNATSSFTIVTIPSGTPQVPAGGFLLIADDTYQAGSGPTRDAAFGSGADLEQNDGGVLLEDASSTPVDDVQWGSPAQQLDCASFIPAEVSPDGDHSIQPNPNPPPPWCRAIPTPGAANGSCVS